MKRYLLLAFFLLFASQLRAADVYIAQTAAGGGTGANCANARAVAGTTWTAGNTYHLCGTITSVITPSASGSAGNLITMQWESGALVSKCDTTGAIRLGGRSYILLDLGANAPAITCPSNGDGLSTSVEAHAISDNLGSGMDHIEIRNGTIGPLYVKAGATHNTGTGSDSVGIYQNGGGNNHYHGLNFTDVAKGINDQLSGTISGDEINNNSFVHFGAGIYYACGGSPCAGSGALLHDNTFTMVADWATTGDFIHMEAIHIYSNGAGTSIAGLMYGNYVSGAWPTISSGSNPNATAGYFIEQASTGAGFGSQTWTVFNNICKMDTGYPGDGCYFVQSDNNTVGLYNNVADCVDKTKTGAAGMELDHGSGNTITFKNNFAINCGEPIYAPFTGGTVTGDYNDYYNFNSGGNGWAWGASFFTTLANWRTACSCDSHAITTNPTLNSDYTLQAGSPAIGAALNLTSLSVSQLDNDKAGVARPAVAAWDIGAFQFVSPGGGSVVSRRR